MTAALALDRCGMTLLGAKRAPEEMLASGRAIVAVPTVEDDADMLMSELAAAGVAAKVLARSRLST